MNEKKTKERIICDTFIKGEKKIFGDDPSTPFNQRILAINEMYGWLYNQGILKEVSFEFKDYSDCAYFALDATDLIPYRKVMEESDCKQALDAVSIIFDEEYTPCRYSGAWEIGWMMNTYRDNCGVVGRSWECDMVKHLNNDGAREIEKVKEEKGVKEAVKALFTQYDWK